MSMIPEVELNILRDWLIVKCRTLERHTIKMRTAQALWYRHGNPIHLYFTHGLRTPRFSFLQSTSYNYYIYNHHVSNQPHSPLKDDLTNMLTCFFEDVFYPFDFVVIKDPEVRQYHLCNLAQLYANTRK